ncbi:hypothetical protein NNJEOMEG_00065 [Fundidesulfovibrio magnetotacticus]|uniref:Uncharacterized protein n=1 Tax=Fundidesulfovibrio magnetotacticus TaxID=2730080 RepID=A0A6V8LHQ6_9BACT|nr:hypothetical protein [Fundidesulfovibrio magnetotacticus]GFK92243.1 hypothetical protein NNJEOMEG_00065 [Fundidesulfovibrio magnetotacticus]
MHLVRLGEHKLYDCWMPMIFQGRYFVVEQAYRMRFVSVFTLRNGRISFEFLRNVPQQSKRSRCLTTPEKIVSLAGGRKGLLYSVSHRGPFLMELHLPEGGVVQAHGLDGSLLVNGFHMECPTFDGTKACCLVTDQGGIACNPRLPLELACLVSLEPI